MVVTKMDLVGRLLIKNTGLFACMASRKIMVATSEKGRSLVSQKPGPPSVRISLETYRRYLGSGQMAQARLMIQRLL